MSSSQKAGTELSLIRMRVWFHQGQGDLSCLCQCIYALCRWDLFALMPLLACSSLPLLSSLSKCGAILSSAPFNPSLSFAPNPLVFKCAVLSGPWGSGTRVPSLSLSQGLTSYFLRDTVRGELDLLSKNEACKQPSLLSGDLGNLWLQRVFASFCWVWADVWFCVPFLVLDLHGPKLLSIISPEGPKFLSHTHIVMPFPPSQQRLCQHWEVAGWWTCPPSLLLHFI